MIRREDDLQPFQMAKADPSPGGVMHRRTISRTVLSPTQPVSVGTTPIAARLRLLDVRVADGAAPNLDDSLGS